VRHGLLPPPQLVDRVAQERGCLVSSKATAYFCWPPCKAQSDFPAELAATGEANMALRSKKPFALLRPPGHHATPTVANGFCSFELDRDRNRWERDGIWDFDGY